MTSYLTENDIICTKIGVSILERQWSLQFVNGLWELGDSRPLGCVQGFLQILLKYFLGIAEALFGFTKGIGTS